MRVNSPLKFKVKLPNGNRAGCLRAHAIKYSNGEISCGFAEGVGDDNFYLRLARKDWDEPIFWFVRRDELEALITVAGASLYIDSIVGEK